MAVGLYNDQFDTMIQQEYSVVFPPLPSGPIHMYETITPVCYTLNPDMAMFKWSDAMV